MKPAPAESALTVLHTLESLRANYGGTVRSVGALAVHLARLGLRIHILATDTGPRDGAWLAPEADGVTVHRVPTWYWRRGRVLWAPAFGRGLAALCRAAAGPLVIHEHGVWRHTCHDTARLARRRGIPRIVSPRGSLTRWALGYKAWKKRLAWTAYQRADLAGARAVHATAEEEADDLRALGVDVPIAVVPNGVEQAPPGPALASRAQTVLFLSRISPKKGLLDWVAAWARVRPPGWRCVVAGPDEEGHRAAVERAVAQAGLQDVFSFYGPASDDRKWELYHAAQLFVLPTHSENFGIVVAEALAAGVPVITTRGAPWRELETHRCGWWCEREPDALAVALREAVALSGADRAEMGRRGRALVEARYGWPPIAARLAAVYEWMLAGGAPPPDVRLGGAPGAAAPPGAEPEPEPTSAPGHEA